MYGMCVSTAVERRCLRSQVCLNVMATLALLVGRAVVVVVVVS